MQNNGDLQQQDKPLNKYLQLLKDNILKIFVISCSLVCFILVIYVLSVSVQYFSYMFSLTDETNAKIYLRNYYKSYIVTLYISIIGMILIISSTIVFLAKFFKKGITIIHVVYGLSIMVSGIVTLTSSSQHFSLLQNYSTSKDCDINSKQYLQCKLSSAFTVYYQQFLNFILVFCSFYIIYTIVYHLGILDELGSNKTNMKQNKPGKVDNQSFEHEINSKMQL